MYMNVFPGEIVGHINIRQPGQTHATRWRCSRARDSVSRAEDEEGEREVVPVSVAGLQDCSQSQHQCSSQH